MNHDLTKSAMDRRGRRFRSTMGGLAILVLMAGCGRDTAAPKSESRSQLANASVSVSQASRKAIREQIVALGSIDAWQELTLSAQTSGVAVMEVTVTENDRVKHGDLLVRLDDRMLKAQIAQQRATIAEAQANVESAQNKAARANVLAASQAMSKEDVEERRMAIKTSQAKLEQAQAALEQLERQWEQTRIVAPADGYVSQKPAVIGTIVQVGTELVRLIRDGRLEVAAKVPDKDLGFIQEQQVARIRVPGGPEIEARVRAVAAKVDPKQAGRGLCESSRAIEGQTRHVRQREHRGRCARGAHHSRGGGGMAGEQGGRLRCRRYRPSDSDRHRHRCA
jgi:multidrug efflux pump subunit AcrA (membrane-fusion protein)